MKKTYLRDRRSPAPLNETISKVMSRNKQSGTKPEILVGKIINRLGYTGYRKNCKNVPGKPDFCFNKRRKAIFVHGCFWHHCPICMKRWPKNNRPYWKTKITRNIERDKKILKELKKLGWLTLTLWDCELRKKEKKCVSKLTKFLNHH